MLTNRCDECDCMLFSDHSKSTGLCPECENESIECKQEFEKDFENGDNILKGLDWSELELETRFENHLK
jgi:uncharacterized Zn finger protein (UPF0148 family)